MTKINCKQFSIQKMASKNFTKIKQSSFLRIFNEVLHEWWDNSSIHGIQKLNKNNFNFLLRFLWFILFLTSFSLFLWNFTLETIRFNENKTYSTIGIKRQTPINFPTITFCNGNGFYTNEGFDYVHYLFNTRYLNFSNIESIYVKDLIDRFNDLIRGNIISDKNLTHNVIKEFSLELKHMIISCYFNSKACNETDFEWLNHAIYGNCYRFNSGQNSSLKKVYSSGSTNGLRLELFLGIPDENDFLMTSNGLFLSINNPEVKGIIPEEGLYVPTGMASNVGFKKVIQNKLSEPYSNCVQDLKFANISELFSKTVEYNNVYTQIYCNKLCYQKTLSHYCACYDPAYPNINGTVQPCISFDDIACKYNMATTISSNAEFYENCEKGCPLECDSITYKNSVYSTHYPSLAYGKIVLKDILEKQLNVSIFSDKNQSSEWIENIILQSSTLQLNLFFETMNVETIYEEPVKSFSSFISNIGGLLGFYMGASILSILEIVEIITLIVIKFR